MSKGILVRAWILLVALAAFLPLHHIQAKTIKTHGEIPIYPGAVRDVNSEKTDPGIPNRYVRVYLVNAPIEEVARFYIQRLGEDFAMKRFHEFKDQINIYNGRVEKSGLEKKKTLAKYRKPFQKDLWLQWIAFVWNEEVDGDTNHYDFTIEDIGLSEDWKTYQPRTKLILLVQEKERASLERAKREQEELIQRSMKVVEDKAETLAKRPPTEKELGVSIYPGSRFDSKLSALYSVDRLIYYYFTNDSPAKVAAFYKQRPGCEIVISNENLHILNFGRIEVSIGTNNFESKEKTCIMVYEKIM